MVIMWQEDKDDDKALAQIQELVKAVHKTAGDRGKLLDFLFMNDANYNQSPLKSYGKEALSFLTEVSGKRDPKGVFQHLQNGGFLLSKA